MGSPGRMDVPATGCTASLCRALELALARPRLLALGVSARSIDDLLLNTADGPTTGTRGRGSPGQGGSASEPRSGAEDAESLRVEALVDLARQGDAEAFGALYDHYVTGIYRFLYARLSSVSLAEDLTSETFFRALRSIPSFSWQGKNFGAWLTTIARNLVTDHYKSSRSRLEVVAEEVPERVDTSADTESTVLASLSSQDLVDAMNSLAQEQRDCLVMRFFQGLSIADTAAVFGRSDGAIKQLQLRAVRNLAKQLPGGAR